MHLISDHRHHRHRTQDQQQQEVVENREGLLHYCTICNRSFTRRRDLERHMRSARVHVSNDNSMNAGFPCRMCAKIFARQDTQRRHGVNKSCMERYSRFLRDARPWISPPLPFSLSMAFCETTPGADVEPITSEIDIYYNSDIQSITTNDTQDDYFVDTPSSLST